MNQITDIKHETLQIHKIICKLVGLPWLIHFIYIFCEQSYDIIFHEMENNLKNCEPNDFLFYTPIDNLKFYGQEKNSHSMMDFFMNND